MTKTELIASLAAKLNCTKKDAAAVLDATFATIQDTLETGEKVSVTGFGTFEVRHKEEKTCINPKTKAKMVCPPCNAPAFKAGRALKAVLNNK